MMKKILLWIALVSVSLSFAQTARADLLSASQAQRSFSVASKYAPTEIFVMNYSAHPVQVSTPNLSLPDVVLSPSPADYYYYHITSQASLDVRVVLYDYVGRKFFDKYIGHHNTVTIFDPDMKNQAPRVVIS